ncbi:hypothetical protein V500_00296 [Pseudogymnoascus sp. VKM F-4518 (FW-2643)]|nr:hypothetical protein V500_00296 [Pseudogymnoascus sp. VKM F-4518 (FW-2643)]
MVYLISLLVALVAFTPCTVVAQESVGQSKGRIQYYTEDFHGHKRPRCTVLPRGDQKSDVPNILKAFKRCNNGGTVYFPENKSYWIPEPLNPVIHDVEIIWKGQWKFSEDLPYWRAAAYPIAFQNHAVSFVLTGSKITIDGHGVGGIDGGGDPWYTADKGKSTIGRPMPFLFWNVTDVHVQDFYVKQPALWSVNIMNGTNMYFKNINTSAISTEAPSGANWVQNTDGFNTMDAHSITLDGFHYRGGDDCIAIKPRSNDIFINDVTCNGGNGIAIGSVAQYLEDNSVENVIIQNAKVPDTALGVYIKIWTGVLVPQTNYESCCEPRGGDWGNVRNLTFANIDVTGAKKALWVGQNSGGNTSTRGTSKMQMSEIYFTNFTGVLNSTTNSADFTCSSVYPCYDIFFTNTTVVSTTGATLKGSCALATPGGIHGLPGC